MRKTVGFASLVVLACGAAALAACSGEAGPGTNGDPNGNGNGNGNGDDPGIIDPNGNGTGDDGGGGGGNDPDANCASSSAQATLVKKPVDIVFVIDNSGSMTNEIVQVQKQLNENFANIIGASGIDYRVIVVARHGSPTTGQSVCVSTPLSSLTAQQCVDIGAASASLTPKPGETARFFHFSTEIASTDAWCKILSTFNATDEHNLHVGGWSALLRQNAFKTFVVISDDRMNCSFGGTTYNDEDKIDKGAAAAAAFDTSFRALSPGDATTIPVGQFGTAAKRNYRFHSIVGLAPFDAADLTKPTPPTSPVTLTDCATDAVNSGTGHQAMSILTGGLRYPSCRPPNQTADKTDFSPIFKDIANGIVQGTAVACDFPVPQPAQGETLDMATLAVQYKPGGTGTVQEFAPVAGLGACAPGKFYVTGGATGEIHLCPDTCTTVQADIAADIKVVSGCARINGGPK